MHPIFPQLKHNYACFTKERKGGALLTKDSGDVLEALVDSFDRHCQDRCNSTPPKQAAPENLRQVGRKGMIFPSFFHLKWHNIIERKCTKASRVHTFKKRHGIESFEWNAFTFLSLPRLACLRRLHPPFRHNGSSLMAKSRVPSSQIKLLSAQMQESMRIDVAGRKLEMLTMKGDSGCLLIPKGTERENESWEQRRKKGKKERRWKEMDMRETRQDNHE